MLERQKEIVVEVGKYLFERGFTQLSGGNISVRDPQTNLVAIKPSGVAYGVMKPEDIIIVDINGNVVEGSLSPSIENRYAYRRIQKQTRRKCGYSLPYTLCNCLVAEE